MILNTFSRLYSLPYLARQNEIMHISIMEAKCVVKWSFLELVYFWKTKCP